MRGRWFFYGDKTEARIVATVIEFATTRRTGDRALERAHPMKHGEALGADVCVLALDPTALERQRVASTFSGDAKFGARLHPLGPVRGNAAAPCPFVGDQVSEFVFQRARGFFLFKFVQHRIQFDHPSWPKRAPRRRAHSRVPKNANGIRERRMPQCEAKPMAFSREIGILGAGFTSAYHYARLVNTTWTSSSSSIRSRIFSTSSICASSSSIGCVGRR